MSGVPASPNLEPVPSSARGLRRHFGVALFATVLLLPYACLWNADLLGHDTPEWIDLGRVRSLGHLLHLVAGRHFIGYRPVTALSYVPGSTNPWLHHAVDLLLLWLCLWGLYRLLGADPTISLRWRFLGMAWFAFHPVLEEIVPCPSRRADLLLVWFGLEYFACVARSRGGIRRLLFLLLALGAKEPAVTFPAIAAAWTVWERRRDRNLSFRSCGLDLAMLASFVGLRFAVLRGIGGYDIQRVAGSRAWIPFDYFAILAIPQWHWLAEMWRPAALVLTALAGATASGLLLHAMPLGATRLAPISSVARLGAMVLVLDLGLYLATGFVWSRLLAWALAALLLLCIGLLPRCSRLVRGLLCTLIVSTSGLQIASAPWRRILDQSQVTRSYVEELAQAVVERPPGKLTLVLLDLPATARRASSERRMQNSSLAADPQLDLVPWLPPSPLLRRLHWAAPDHVLELLPLMTAVQVGPISRASGSQTIPESRVAYQIQPRRQRALVDLAADGVEFRAPSRLPGFSLPPQLLTPEGTLFDLRGWSSRDGFVYLSRLGTPVIDGIPERLLVRVAGK